MADSKASSHKRRKSPQPTKRNQGEANSGQGSASSSLGHGQSLHPGNATDGSMISDGPHGQVEPEQVGNVAMVTGTR